MIVAVAPVLPLKDPRPEAPEKVAMCEFDDTRFLTMPVIAAYLETLVGLFALRMPPVQGSIRRAMSPGVSISTSFGAEESLIIPIAGMIDALEKEGFTELESFPRALRLANRMFLSAMWDGLRQHRRFREIKHEPEVQFFRHVRNACAHDGRLNHRNLRYPAMWRDKEITVAMRGAPVFPDLLRDGDPVLLVVDVNNRFFTPIDLSHRLAHE